MYCYLFHYVVTFQKWSDKSLCDDLHLPERNEFIPTNFDLLPKEDNVKLTFIFLLLMLELIFLKFQVFS